MNSRALGVKTFCVTGHKARNSLPESVRVIHSTATFKRRLKTYLFEIAYNL
jgi:hypothetical protein